MPEVITWLAVVEYGCDGQWNFIFIPEVRDVLREAGREGGHVARNGGGAFQAPVVVVVVNQPQHSYMEAHQLWGSLLTKVSRKVGLTCQLV